MAISQTVKIMKIYLIVSRLFYILFISATTLELAKCLQERRILHRRLDASLGASRVPSRSLEGNFDPYYQYLRLIGPLYAHKNNNIEVSTSLLYDVNDDARWLGEQITKWLDMEWIKQPVHQKIGDSCKELYIRLRGQRIHDLGEILMEIGTGLEVVSFDDPDGDAYVNAWDVANKCSDLLMVRMNNNICECMGDMNIFEEGDIQVANVVKEKLEEVRTELSGAFERYKWLARFLDDEEDNSTTMAVLATVLGRRIDSTGEVVFDKEACAYGWAKECNGEPPVAAMLDAENVEMAKRLSQDVPEDEEVTDIAIEPVVGIEMYRQMRDPITASSWDTRRILLAKWLYVHGFMTEDSFPVKTAFIPQNLVEAEKGGEEVEGLV